MIWKLAALLLIPLPSAAYAQALEDEEEQVLCVRGAVVIHWFPSHSESRAIEAVPIPESIRNFMAPGDCGPPLQTFAQLIDWHLRFGSERSTTTALSYGERQLTSGLPAPADYLRALRQARRAFDQGGKRQRPQVARSRAREWKRLAAATVIYLPVADEYLRAAEELRSLPLLDRAEAYLAAIDADTPFLQSLGEAPNDYNEARKDDMRMRIAVLRASVTLGAPDIARANAVLGAVGRPFYQELAERAYDAGSELCDVGDSNSMITLAEQCEQVDAIEARLTSFWLSRAALDSIEGALDPGTTSFARSYASAETAMRLLERAKEPEWDRCGLCWLQNDPKREALFRLRRIRTQADAHRYVSLAAGKDEGAAWSKWVEALDELQTMERAAPPFEAPGRFRRLAESWLSLWRQTPGLRIINVERERAGRERYAAYLQATLPLLPQISTAQGASEPVPAFPD